MCLLGALSYSACHRHAAPTAKQAAQRPTGSTPAAAKAAEGALLGKLTHSVKIDGVPHVKQKPDFCGEACAEMYLRKLGHQIDQDAIFARCKVSPLKGRGCVTHELSKALKATGFQVGATWYKIAVKQAAKQLHQQFYALYSDLRKGIPSIVCMHYHDSPKTTEHFRLILGYDKATDEVIYHEPAESRGAYRRMKRRLFLKLWPLKYKAHEWLAVRMRLKPGKIKPVTPPASFSDADYVQHVMALKKRLPRGFTVVLEKPFVVLGDEAPAMVWRRAKTTVRWAVRQLKKQYFKKDPKHILDIWLFKDKRSYMKHTKQLFGETPSTPYGYYSGRHKALIMNIATGGGTLVHEIVHPFVESNFHGYRAWFNEGLGSLYEQCDERNGKIVGLTNWRLAGLQSAIRAGRVPAFKTLLSTSETQFYDRDPGTNYAQSRYLMFYLQEKGLLHRFYHTYFKRKKTDPTGWKTLRDILKIKRPKAFQKKWEKWVLTLRFPA